MWTHQGKEEEGGQTLDGKLQAREIRQRRKDNATNRAEWRRKLISYTGDPRDEEEDAANPLTGMLNVMS